MGRGVRGAGIEKEAIRRFAGLLSECTAIAGMARATVPETNRPWQDSVDEYDRIRETMAKVIEGFGDLNVKARRSHGFRSGSPLDRVVVEIRPSAGAEG